MTRKRKSVRLEPQEVKALKKFRNGFTSSEECATVIGIGRVVLERIILVGSGSENSVGKIREALQRLS